MKRIVIGAFGAALLAGATLWSGSASATDIRLLSSWNTSVVSGSAVYEHYVKLVHESGAGKVKITVNGPETVPPFQQLQPVSAGVFDMLHTAGVYHAGNKGLALAADAIVTDPYKRREAGIIDYIDKYYQKHNNVKVIALTGMSLSGYQIIAKAPLSADGDLKGRKIRGVANYHGAIRALGAIPVVLPTGEVYSGLEKGVIDGSGWTSAGILSAKLYEVAKYAVRPTFGSGNNPVFINVDRWNKLTKEEQGIIADGGKRLEFEMPWVGEGIYQREEAGLKKLGMNYVQLTPEKAAHVQRSWNESIWALAKECCGDGVDGLRDLALKNGMTN
jgi:TRAP-type C4-dicarboxylate transport system substrate-binding protein